jgi:hypothetical protein
MASTYKLSASGKLFADIFTRANDHFERDEVEESKRLSTNYTISKTTYLPHHQQNKPSEEGESHQVDHGFIFMCEEQQRFHSRGGNAEIRTHDLRKIHLRLAMAVMPTARPPPLVDEAMVLGEGCGNGWVYMGLRDGGCIPRPQRSSPHKRHFSTLLKSLSSKHK